jgi:hypothetical protein
MRKVALVLFALALGGCERGCLARWLAGEEKSAEPARERGLDLSGTDCSDGLLRCQNGQVEASRIGHVPATCGQGLSPEKKASACTCPWDLVETCACAVEGIEIASTSDAGARQLCAPREPVARPVLASDDASVEVCAEEGIRCRDSVVRVCDGPAAASRPVAWCIFGCASGIQVLETEDGPAVNPGGAVPILCRRSDAERR